MRTEIEQIISIAEAEDGFYDGRLEDVIPWTFWLNDLPTPLEDAARLARIWKGDYLEYYQFGKRESERYLYLFRDGLGMGVLSVSENMGLDYLQFFLTREHAQQEIARLGKPASVTRGLPLASVIAELDIPDDELPELFAVARSIAIDYVDGNDYSGSVQDLVLFFRGLTEPDSDITLVMGFPQEHPYKHDYCQMATLSR